MKQRKRISIHHSTLLKKSKEHKKKLPRVEAFSC